MFFEAMHVIHVAAVILWIGGLGFITIVMLPMVIKMPDALQKVLLFGRIEHKFAPLARVYNAVTGITGFIMMFSMGWQKMLLTREGHTLLFMLAVWVFWFVMLFGLEPLIIRKMLDKLAKSGEKTEIETIFTRMNKLHVILLILSLLASAAGIMFAHGYVI